MLNDQLFFVKLMKNHASTCTWTFGNLTSRNNCRMISVLSGNLSCFCADVSFKLFSSLRMCVCVCVCICKLSVFVSLLHLKILFIYFTRHFSQTAHTNVSLLHIYLILFVNFQNVFSQGLLYCTCIYLLCCTEIIFSSKSIHMFYCS